MQSQSTILYILGYTRFSKVTQYLGGTSTSDTRVPRQWTVLWPKTHGSPADCDDASEVLAAVGLESGMDVDLR